MHQLTPLAGEGTQSDGREGSTSPRDGEAGTRVTRTPRAEVGERVRVVGRFVCLPLTVEGNGRRLGVSSLPRMCPVPKEDP